MRPAQTLRDADAAQLVRGGRLLRRSLGGWTSIPVGLFGGMTVVYLAVRLPLWNPHAPLLATALLAAEMFGLATLALHVFATFTLLDRTAVAPGPQATADILITTWNEPAELLRNTLLAAKAVRHVGTVWLLDDGCRPEMRALAEDLGVAYLERRERDDAKAGNLNHALKHCQAEFVALFDCDHAPSPEFLERTLGYFADKRLAFVQTPQDYYNIDSFQHRARPDAGEFWHEQALFYRVIQPGKDRWNAAFFCGSCAILRRSALDDIGGFATGTITEDIHTSLKFHKRGWRSAYHNETLAFGLSPSNIDQYLTQRLRWARGAMQVWRKEGILFAPGLTLPQRLCYLTSVITYFEGWQKLVLYTMPIAVLFTGVTPLTSITSGFICLFLLWLGAGMWVNQIASRGYARTIWMEEYNLLRYFIFLRASLALFIPKDWHFAVTPKVQAGEERLHFKLWPQIVLAVAAILAIAFGALRARYGGYLPLGALLFNMGWLTLCASLVIKTLWFTTGRMIQRRDHHRFSLPAPVTIQGEDGRRYRTLAEDCSLNGMKLSLGSGASLPAQVRGKLHLPGGKPASFTAEVIGGPVTAGNARSVRLKVEWADAAARDAVRALLFGNALQWDVNDWADLRRSSGRRSPADPRWIFCQLRTGERTIPCIARRQGEGNRWRVVGYRPFNARPIQALVLNESISIRGLRLNSYRSYPIGRGGVFVGELASSGERSLALEHVPFTRRPVTCARAVGETL